ncbi:3',5'-cyclic-nucleotide phosphodiesterase [Stygiomarasmius scandens]|uniref:Phosphodiesterase n=1 Tax=Marasmiellus scandens TaxID=2682957 RepID=A0ABR1J6U1_9AGAR
MKHPRPRSADLGGLLLATAGSGHGGGWLGHGDPLSGTYFAELLSDMYNETLHAVNEHQGSLSFIAERVDIPQETREKLVGTLDEWGFEPHMLNEEEVVGCTMILFEALFRIEGMKEDVGVTLDRIYPLIHHLRLIYRRETSYHNFEHALDVLQASYIFLREAGIVPSVRIVLDHDSSNLWKREQKTGLITCLRNSDIFVLYIAAIGHDVAHPGITNGFMKNASAPLSQVYDNKSPLENLHCSVLLRVMRQHQFSDLLDESPLLKQQRAQDESAVNGGKCTKNIRRLLHDTVLATDMSVHQAWMNNFRMVLDDIRAGNDVEQDEEDWKKRVLMCQAIIKCADISNPSRPFTISRHWSTALMSEWTSQASLERCLGLPCTVQDKDDPHSEAKSQIFFGSTFAKPLWEVLVEGVPELQPFLDQCNSNLETWHQCQARLELQAATTSTPSSEKTESDAFSETDSPPPSSAHSSTTPLPIPPPSSSASDSSSSSFGDTSAFSALSRSRELDNYATAFPLALPWYRSESGEEEMSEQASHVGEAGSDNGSRPLQGEAGASRVAGNIRVDVNISNSAHSRPISNATSATLFSPGGVRASSKSHGKHGRHKSTRSSISVKGERKRHSRSKSFNSPDGNGEDAPYSPVSDTSTSLFMDSPSGDERDDDDASQSGDSEYHSASGWSSRSSSLDLRRDSTSRSPSRSRSRSRSPSPSPASSLVEDSAEERRNRTTSVVSTLSLSSGSSQVSATNEKAEGTLLKKRSFTGDGGHFKFGGKGGGNGSTTNLWSMRNGNGQRSYTPVPSIISTTSTHNQDTAHAALRAAADSAPAGLRKKRSMLNRISWSPSVAEFKDMDKERSPKAPMVNGGFLAPRYSPSPSPSLSFSPSLSPSPPPPVSPLLLPPPPPLSSPASFGTYAENSSAGNEDKDHDITPKKPKHTKGNASTKENVIVLAEPQPQQASIPVLSKSVEVVEGTKVQLLPV